MQVGVGGGGGGGGADGGRGGGDIEEVEMEETKGEVVCDKVERRRSLKIAWSLEASGAHI